MAGPPDSPEFLCGRCKRLMCEDCQSIAAEYEYLYQSRSLELIRLQEENEELRRDLKRAEKSKQDYERVAKIGYADLICGYIDWLAINGKEAGD